MPCAMVKWFRRGRASDKSVLSSQGGNASVEDGLRAIAPRVIAVRIGHFNVPWEFARCRFSQFGTQAERKREPAKLAQTKSRTHPLAIPHRDRA
jgi:hypothetical protein